MTDTCAYPVGRLTLCGRPGVAVDARSRRPVCRHHAPWYPAKLGADPAAVRPSPCCGKTLLPVWSTLDRRSQVIAYERCPCGMVFDFGRGGAP